MRKTILAASTAMTVATMPRAFAGTPAPAKAPTVTPTFTGTHVGIAMPVKTSNRGSKSIYPFNTLTVVGAAFGVKGKDAKSLSSVISNANRKAPLVNKVDADGNPVFIMNELRAADGSVTHVPTDKIEQVPSAHYFAADVDDEMKAKIKGTPLEGATALVFRDA